MFRTALLSLIALLLTACGGGGSSEPAVSTIQLFGDSTMHQVAPLVAERYAGRVTDRAKGGTSSSQLLAGTDKVNLPWPQSVAADFVIVNHGLNDGYTMKRITLDQYRDNLRRLASAPGAVVIFQTPLPATVAQRDMSGYAQVMREVAAERGLRVIDVFACFQQAPGWPALLPDGTHPSADGERVMLACMTPTLDTL